MLTESSFAWRAVVSRGLRWGGLAWLGLCLTAAGFNPSVPGVIGPRTAEAVQDTPPTEPPPPETPASSEPSDKPVPEAAEPAESPTSSDDEVPVPEGDAGSSAAGQPASPPASREADDELTEDDLAEQIDPNRRPPLAEARDRLEQAIEKMRTAKDRLTQSDTGDDTRKLQNQAADELQKILDLLQQPPPPSQSQSQNQQQNQQQQQQNQQRNQQQRQSRSQQQRQQRQRQQQQRQSGSRRQRQQNRNRQLAQQQPQPGQQQPGERSESPQDAQEKLDPAQQKAAEEARRRAVANDVWGHLPPNVREALQKSFNERYLPKYEELVRRYYESLAEKQRD